MVGCALQAGGGHVTVDQVREMVSHPDYVVPDYKSQALMLHKAPPEGLTSLGATFDEGSLEGETDDLMRLPVGPSPDPDLMRPTIDWEDKDMEKRIMKLTDNFLKKRLVKTSTQVSEDVKKVLASNSSENLTELVEDSDNRPTRVIVGLMKIVNGDSDKKSIETSESKSIGVEANSPSSSVYGA